MRPSVVHRAELILVTFLLLIAAAGLSGCRNPGQSSLPPSAIGKSVTPLPPLPKGDVYADETAAGAESLIEEGDTLDVVVRRGVGEEKFSGVVRQSGKLTLSFVEVEVGGLTVAQAEALIQDKLSAYMRNPRVQAQLKKRVMRVKRVFVFGDVKKPGVYPMPRNMTVIQALSLAENYNETALLEEIRVVRGNLERPEIHTADLARLFTYGDYSRNLPLQENDIVFVPREHMGDGAETAKKLLPIIQTAITPFYPAFFIPAIVRP